MSAVALTELVLHLPRLSPSAASLAALARSSPEGAWEDIRVDPGAVLLLARYAPPALSRTPLSFFPTLLHDPSLCEEALRQFDQGGFVDWAQSATEPIYHASLTYARLAALVAERAGRCDARLAWMAGLLAPLGWLAVCAQSPEQAVACLAEPGFARHSAATQQRLWGLDQSALGRRLARHWHLPDWLAAIVGHLGLPTSTALTLGAEATLLRVAQLAVALAQEQGIALALPVGASISEAAAALGLPVGDMEQLEREARAFVAEPAAPRAWQPPSAMPLLRDLLCLAADNRRLHHRPLVTRLQTEVDDLHQAVEEQHAAQAEQLQARKLSALAEFAAGAGHEINNPLAVISGQAQYLLRHEADGARQQALQTIIHQTHRIHETLRELMQFARPPQPQKQHLDIHGLVCEVLTSLTDLATERKVRLVYPDAQPGLILQADPMHLRTALTSLLRNAIEAAGRGDSPSTTPDSPPEFVGWARARLEKLGADQIDVVVEDSGNGPEWQQREHLFDPFYSGRQAGRGRGLGLPTAWRLARQHGGDVRFISLPDGPTRFVMSLPHSLSTNGHS